MKALDAIALSPLSLPWRGDSRANGLMQFGYKPHLREHWRPLVSLWRSSFVGSRRS